MLYRVCQHAINSGNSHAGFVLLPARQQFFHYTYFILGDASDMPMDSTLERQEEG